MDGSLWKQDESEAAAMQADISSLDSDRRLEKLLAKQQGSEFSGDFCRISTLRGAHVFEFPNPIFTTHATSTPRNVHSISPLEVSTESSNTHDPRLTKTVSFYRNRLSYLGRVARKPIDVDDDFADDAYRPPHS